MCPVQKVDYAEPYHWKLLKFYRYKHEYPIRKVSKYFSGSKVGLDIGCGDGKRTHLLAQRLRRVYGIDNQFEGLRHARSLIPEKNVMLVQADATDLPFADGSFDVVTTFDLIEHLKPEETELFLKEIKRILAQEGMVVITTPNRVNIRKVVLRQKMIPTHCQEFSFEELSILLRNHSFRVVEMTGVYLPIPLPLIEKLARVWPFVYFFILLIKAGALFPKLSETMLVVARRGDGR